MISVIQEYDLASIGKIAAALGISLFTAKKIWNKYRKDVSLGKYGKKRSVSWTDIVKDVGEGL